MSLNMAKLNFLGFSNLNSKFLFFSLIIILISVSPSSLSDVLRSFKSYELSSSIDTFSYGLLTISPRWPAISSAFDSEIGVAATTLRDNANVRAEVEGHTDSIGDDNYNQQLSERRAMAVRDLLVNQHGVAASQVTAVGRGETMPIASNKSAEGRNANRRVDLVLDIVK